MYSMYLHIINMLSNVKSEPTYNDYTRVFKVGAIFEECYYTASIYLFFIYFKLVPTHLVDKPLLWSASTKKEKVRIQIQAS